MTRLVAVTGATGFLGRHLVAALAREGAAVRVLARRPVAAEDWSGPPPAVIRGDLADFQALNRLVEGADCVVHVAGLIAALDAAAFQRANRDATRALAQLTRLKAPDARFVLVSSLAARAPHVSPYAASKRAGEDATRTVYGEAPEKLIIVRPPAIYGPGDRATLSLFQAARLPLVPLFGSGRFALVHVADAAAAIARLAMGAGEAGCFALADDNPAGYRSTEIMAKAARIMERHPRFLPLPAGVLLAAGSVSQAWGRLRGTASFFSLGKAREMLHPDWSVHADELLPPEIQPPRIAIAEGFRETIAWYRAAGWL